MTNPESDAVPEQILVGLRSDPNYISFSNLDGGTEKVLDDKQARDLALRLHFIHLHFKALYNGDDDFAIEIEFKYDEQNKLVIKQARPWVD